jgi:hypothetical protein
MTFGQSVLTILTLYALVGVIAAVVVGLIRLLTCIIRLGSRRGGS